MLAPLRVDALLLGATRQSFRLVVAPAFRTEAAPLHPQCARLVCIKLPCTHFVCGEEERMQLAEVFPVAAGAGPDLALILRTNC